MKLFFLIITLLFSVSVLADCCNDEVEVSSDAVHEHCQDEAPSKAQTKTTHHCHCTPMGHLRFISDSSVSLIIPSPSSELPIPSHTSHLSSSYEALIFHPPIA